MTKTELIKRRFNKETYTFYLNEGVGCFGIDSIYISCETPENYLGYTDTVLLSSKNNAYTLHRNLPNWILKKIEAKMLELQDKHCFGM